MDVVRGCESTKESENGGNNKTKDDNFAEDWSTGTEICPLASTFCKIALDLFSAKLEPNHSTESNSISEALEWSDESSPDNDGKTDEENILQNTAQSEDENRGFANLHIMLVMNFVFTKEDFLTKNTTETFSMNAHIALAKRVQNPTL